MIVRAEGVVPEVTNPRSPGGAGEGWRGDLLQRFAWLLFAFGTPLVAYVSAVRPGPFATAHGPLENASLWLVPATAALVGATAGHTAVRGAALLVVLVLLGAVGARSWGPTPGVLLCPLVASVLATLLFGRRTAALVLVLTGVDLLVFGSLGRAETTPPWSADLLSQTGWIRIAFTYTVLAGSLQLLVSGALKRVEAGLGETREALGASVREREARVAAEQVSREYAERLRQALDAADMGTWEWDTTSGRIVWTGRAEGLLGVAPGAPATIDTFRETVHPADRETVEAAIEAALAGPDDEFTAEHRPAADPSRWLQGRGRVYRDVDGRPVRMRGTVQDVTARHRAEERLRASEERWRRISEATFEGIGFSENGRIVDANEQLARMLGYTTDELVGRPVVECVAPEDRQRVMSAVRSGKGAAYEHRALRKDGSSVIVETRARTLSAGGRELRVTAVRDVSERARLEGELRRAERLAAIGALVGGVAHEVRTPLFSISATIDAMDVHVDRPESERELRALLRSQVKRLSSLMQDLLDYGRPPTLQARPTAPVEAVLRAARRCERMAQQAGVQICTALPEGLPELELDAARIDQVLENLVTNAVQHSPRGSTVGITATWSDVPTPGLRLSVEDEGPGIAPPDLERVFEPFFTRRKGGTGLGLAIAHRLVEAHGGTLTAANRAGRGAAFTVFLPRARAGLARDV
jgi:PAS domain S-box-containing protein